MGVFKRPRFHGPGERVLQEPDARPTIVAAHRAFRTQPLLSHLLESLL